MKYNKTKELLTRRSDFCDHSNDKNGDLAIHVAFVEGCGLQVHTLQAKIKRNIFFKNY